MWRGAFGALPNTQPGSNPRPQAMSYAEDHAAVRLRSIQHCREARGAVIPKVPYQKILLTLPLSTSKPGLQGTEAT